MRDYLRLTVVLLTISAVAGGLLALVDSFTGPKIRNYQALAETRACRGVLPQADTFKRIAAGQLARLRANPATAGIEDIKIGFRKGQLVGWVCKIVSHGYSSNIRLLAGLARDAGLVGVTVLEQNETPGLGAKINESRFIRQAILQNANPQQDLQVDKDGGLVQAVAGATISSRAVVRSINQAFYFFRGQTGSRETAPEQDTDAAADLPDRK